MGRLDSAAAELSGLIADARAGELDRATAVAAVAEARALAAAIDAAELAAIDAARAAGATWNEVAAAIGAATRQGAQKRRADLARRVPDHGLVTHVTGDLAATVLHDGSRVVLPADGRWAGSAFLPPAGTEPAAGGQETSAADVQDATAAAGGSPQRLTDGEYSRTLKHHQVNGLGAEWTYTQDDHGDVVLWREKTVKAGGARRDYLKGGWEPMSPRLYRLRAGNQPSRVKALLAAAGEFEQRRRKATPAGPDVPLPGAGGWVLRQTLADRDDRTWLVVAPDGTAAGTVSPSYRGARSWSASAGNPADGTYYHPAVVSPAGSDEKNLAAGDGSDWKTRDAAAYAIAHFHDPAGNRPAAEAVARAAGLRTAARERRARPGAAAGFPLPPRATSS